MYVLEAKLQNDQKLPKWNRRARLGQFVEFSDEHSSFVANDLTTRYISPQFHVVLTTCLKQRIAQVWMIASSSLFAMDFFSVIENFMLKTNLMRLVISFTNLLPYIRFSLMKQDAAKEMRIVSVSAVVGTLPQGYVRNVPLPRIPLQQSTRSNQIHNLITTRYRMEFLHTILHIA